MSNKRRSVSAEMGKYIDHLEMELAAAQAQISAITSPTVTREQSSKVRHLNAETKQLQQELDEWETKYEQRVQDALDEHVAVENGLRNRIRSLEEDADDTQLRLQQLERELEGANERTNATESANVNLEKRLEIMSELLAASPTKIDLHAETPGRRKRQQRPQSMLPRFPTATSLVCSPERQSCTQPASPLLSFANRDSPSIAFSPTHEPLRLDVSPQPSDVEQTDAESVFSDVHGPADSITSVETSESQPAFNPWSLPPVRDTKARPARRMRRFGAGSMGPKPLILPSTSACEQYPPASAPPLERSETTPAPFPNLLDADDDDNDDIDLSLFGRRRASTTTGEIRVSSLERPPAFLEVPQDGEGEDSMLSLLTPHAEKFPDGDGDEKGDFSSIGSNVGRNLMEELSRMETNESGSVRDTEDITDLPLDVDVDNTSPDMGAITVRNDAQTPGQEADVRLPTSPSTTQPHKPLHSRSRSRTASTALDPTLSIFARLRLLFADFWHSPVALARHLVQAAQSRMRLPSPLLNAQWWLVGVLLGPMARRRMLAAPRHENRCGDDCESPLLHRSWDGDVEDKADGSEAEGLAYGTFHPTPPSSPRHHRRQGSVADRGKRRAATKTRCSHYHHSRRERRKHSPLMWLKFSLTLAFAVGAAFKDGPASLLKGGGCGCWALTGERNRTNSS